nr:hypothetical protein [uncultured Draconibacterium sp.]
MISEKISLSKVVAYFISLQLQNPVLSAQTVGIKNKSFFLCNGFTSAKSNFILCYTKVQLLQIFKKDKLKL